MNIEDYNNQYQNLENIIQSLKNQQQKQDVNYSQILYELQSIENQLQMFTNDHEKLTNQIKDLKNCKIESQIDNKKILEHIQFSYPIFQEEQTKEEESLLLFQSLEPQLQAQEKLQQSNLKNMSFYDNNSGNVSKKNQNFQTNDATKISFFQASQDNTENFFSNLYQENEKIPKKNYYKSVDKKPGNKFQRCGSQRLQNKILPRVKNLAPKKQQSLCNNNTSSSAQIRQRNFSQNKTLQTELSFSRIEKNPTKSQISIKNDSLGRNKSQSGIKKPKTLKVQRIQLDKLKLEKVLTKVQANSEISRINFRKNEFIVDPLEVIFQFFSNTVQNGLTIDLRQNKIQYSQWADSQKQKLESKNIKILNQFIL